MIAQNRAYYELLEIEPDASAADVKRAFRRKALAVHPDRNSSSDAHVAFQHLRHVHDVLIDPDKRILYDQGGENAVKDDHIGNVDAAFWARASSSITPEDIARYEKEYPGSQEERDDLAAHYRRFDGKIDKVISFIPYSEDTDLLRFIQQFDEMIEAGILSPSKTYDVARETLFKRGKAAQQRANGSKQATVAKSSKTSSDDALTALIRGRAKQREKNFDEWADSLATKYQSRRHNAKDAGGSSERKSQTRDRTSSREHSSSSKPRGKPGSSIKKSRTKRR